jgi:ribonuclease HI
MRKYNLKMNTLKCVFGVSAGRFLGFVVQEEGIEIDPKKVESIKKFAEPTCKRDVQKLLGKINYLRRFIANFAGKVESFLPLICLKHEKEFRWGNEQKEAFDKIKEYLVSPHVLRALKMGAGFKLYIAAQRNVIGAYLSRRLLDAETRYTFIEKLCLTLYYACTKCCHYLLASCCTIVCQYDVIKYMLQKPILSGRLGKWVYALVEYDLEYELLKAMKGQVVADFIVDHNIELCSDICVVEKGTWKMFFDGSVCSQGQGVGCLIVSPHGVEHEVSIRLEFWCTNNQAEYEALLSGLETLADMGVSRVNIFGDSQLVAQQINGENQCLDGMLNGYREKCLDVLGSLERFSINHVPREVNVRANMLAQPALGYDVRKGKFKVKGERGYSDVMAIRGADDGTSHNGESEKTDWRDELSKCISEPGKVKDRKVWRQALKYVVINDVLYRRTLDGVLLKCLSEEEASIAMGEVHEGMCGTHQSAYKMRWVLRRAGVYWPIMLKVCFKYYKGCEACQKFGKVQSAPASMLHPIVKPWPFRGWGLDFIGEIHPSSTKGHRFVLMATDYFTK